MARNNYAFIDCMHVVCENIALFDCGHKWESSHTMRAALSGELWTNMNMHVCRTVGSDRPPKVPHVMYARTARARTFRLRCVVSATLFFAIMAHTLIEPKEFYAGKVVLLIISHRKTQSTDNQNGIRYGRGIQPHCCGRRILTCPLSTRGSTENVGYGIWILYV